MSGVNPYSLGDNDVICDSTWSFLPVSFAVLDRMDWWGHLVCSCQPPAMNRSSRLDSGLEIGKGVRVEMAAR